MTCPRSSPCSEHGLVYLDERRPEHVDLILSAYTCDPPRIIENEDGTIDLRDRHQPHTPWDAAIFAPPWHDLEGLDAETLRPVLGDDYGPLDYAEACRRYEQSRDGGGLWDDATATAYDLRNEQTKREAWLARMQRRRVRVEGGRPVRVVRVMSGTQGRIRVR